MALNKTFSRLQKPRERSLPAPAGMRA